jgi:hypothetical protein
MAELPVPFEETRLCPACDYDLQGNTSGRCPECGTLVGAGRLSRVPWVHRARRGDRRAYFETLGLLLFRPGRLAREAGWRVPLAHARRFHRESIWLATIFLAAALTVAFLLRGPTIEAFAMPSLRQLVEGDPWPVPWTPALVLTDSFLLLAPLAAGVHLALHASTWMYRRLFAAGASARGRRRAAVLAFYGSGLTPVVGVFGGGFLICAVARVDMDVTPTWGWRLVFVTMLACLSLAMWTFYYPTLVMLRKAGGAGMRRLFVMAYLFPLLQLFVWPAILVGMFWVAGYVALAFWSVSH